ncbi:hypothetical protein Pint_29541 [Pistacia integerrima]|uniref:Uncharacterized protein n=1 Tax=Pistacia integerrima TaxID=434235 RepID=A0ACC0X2G0_9ROSI|nr:hypothetical protein Pint_29541 [Pistacia integerrima]
MIVFMGIWIYVSAKVDFKSLAKREGSLKSNSRGFTYSEIVSMTNNFERVLGKGGFGTVYHGYLVDGTQVAVKMLCPSSTQASIQFRTEAQFLIRVHHRNLASFVGYCNDSRNFAIIYEYMAYGNLEEYLLDKRKEALSWKERVEIALGAAQGNNKQNNLLRLEGNFDTNSVWKAVETAMECLPPISIQRPSMSHVVMQLKECLEMEIAREQASQIESQMMESNNSMDMSPVDLETEKVPEAR